MARVLFICPTNAGTSPMSRALFDLEADGRHESASAGSAPGDQLQPEVVTAMRELGIDLSGVRPQLLTQELGGWADVVVTMGPGSASPSTPGARTITWTLPDPADLPLGEIREIRHDIDLRIRDLVAELDEAAR
ncbi:unannotated protein [freshwater metagenome]|uniref:Unannotated protein n=1 Tax=freshwater metagenome TaxID=449393 RepID=A0A6J7CVT4_9ZZZZ|nr:heat-shock protein HtpX [Actinomycetota bacterium]